MSQLIRPSSTLTINMATSRCRQTRGSLPVAQIWRTGPVDRWDPALVVSSCSCSTWTTVICQSLVNPPSWLFHLRIPASLPLPSVKLHIQPSTNFVQIHLKLNYIYVSVFNLEWSVRTALHKCPIAATFWPASCNCSASCATSLTSGSERARDLFLMSLNSETDVLPAKSYSFCTIMKWWISKRFSPLVFRPLADEGMST